MKKYIAEFIGTMVLVICGCGTAMIVGCESFRGYLLTALMFGMAIIAMAYSIGNISGCHINPAISLAMLISKKIDVKDFIGYVVAQFVGAFVGTGVLKAIFHFSKLQGSDHTMLGYGSNGIAKLDDNIVAALIIEIALTFIFTIVVLGVTSKNEYAPIAGVVIGMALTLVHIIGIPLTGTSVNPARSFGPALMALISNNSGPIKIVWIFIVAPLIGAAIAAVLYKILDKKE